MIIENQNSFEEEDYENENKEKPQSIKKVYIQENNGNKETKIKTKEKKNTKILKSKTVIN